MSRIQTVQQGTFLSIDRFSVDEVVTQTLTRLGLAFTANHRTRGVKGRDAAGCPVVGYRSYDTYSLHGYGIVGPMGENMHAVLKVQDTSIPGMRFKLSLGVMRLVCLNGMFGFGSAFDTTVTHRVGPMADGKLAALPAALDTALQALPALAEAALELAAVEVPDPASVVYSLDLPASVKENVLRLLARGSHREVDQPSNAWGLYNICNEVDRLLARRGSAAYLERDEQLADDIVCLASAQTLDAA